MIKKPRDCAFTSFSHHAVPCGKCYQCRMSRGAGWAFRLLQESKQHDRMGFFSLTYSNRNLPMLDAGVPTLVKDDVQRFMKRVRFATPRPVKYYLCGEYGENTHRPHYHAIMFGASMDVVSKAWTAGHVRCDPVTMATISYVCGYVNKPSFKFNDGRLPEFSLMSKGLGASYLTDEMKKYHRDNMASFITLDGGVRKGLPRYYRDKIFTEDERKVLAEIAAAKHELELVESEMDVGWHVAERDRNEGIKAAIKRQSLNLKKRNKL